MILFRHGSQHRPADRRTAEGQPAAARCRAQGRKHRSDPARPHPSPSATATPVDQAPRLATDRRLQEPRGVRGRFALVLGSDQAGQRDGRVRSGASALRARWGFRVDASACRDSASASTGTSTCPSSAQTGEGGGRAGTRVAEAKRVCLAGPRWWPFARVALRCSGMVASVVLAGQASRSDAARIASVMTGFWSASAPGGYAKRCSARTTSVAPVSGYSTTSGRWVVETTR